jgi:glycosyltransferase involved in cell wall biosynthesis
MMSPSNQPRVTVLQDGARLHYAVPIALQRVGILDRVYTDWYVRPRSIESVVTPVLRWIQPNLARRMAERVEPELDPARVRSKPTLTVSQLFGRRKFKNDLDYYAWLSDLTARWVLDRGFGESNVLFGFVRNIFPGLCATARDRGLKVVTDQMIAPRTIEHAESVKQQQRFSGWSEFRSSASERMLMDFERATWESSSRITCASEYVQEGLVNAGVPPEKIAVVPYPIRFDRTAAALDRRGRKGPITVGFVGEVGLRKGAPYFFQVAQRFDPARVRFVMVGAIALLPGVANQHRGHVELVGPVPRSQVPQWLERFDVLLFPSTCEGSAGAVAEAMSAALPIITSPNSGSLVRHGVDGFISLYDDVDRKTPFITRLLDDADLRHVMGQSARDRVAEFGIDRYGKAMSSLLAGLL